MKLLRNYKFWVLAAMLAAGAGISYPHEILGWRSASFFSFAGLDGFTAERFLLLIPVIYASFVFDIKGCIAATIAAAAIMLPRVVSQGISLTEPWLETAVILAIGLMAGLGINYFRTCIATQKNTEELLNKIIDGSPTATFAIDSQHQVIRWNYAMERLSGIKRQDIVGTDGQWRPFYTTKRPVMADMIISGTPLDEVNRRYADNREKSKLIEGAYESENYLSGTGSEGRWLHFTASPIRDNRGNIVGAVETMQDITETKKAEEALQKSERRFRDVFENALDPIWLHDLDGYIIIANQAAAKITGMTTGEMVNKNVKEFLTPGGLKLAREIRRRLIVEHSIESPYELQIINVNGDEAVFMIKSNLIVIDGKPIGIQNIARDVTQERQMTENLRYYLHQITRAQEDERKRVSRELHDSTAQNLIALLHRLESLLHSRHIPAEEAKQLQTIYEQIREMLQEIRRFSRDLRPSILDDLGLLPALEWVTDQIKNEYSINTSLKVLENNQIRLSSETELLLFRIVQEALRNIGKHAHATRADVTVRLGQSYTTVTISDDGSGFKIPENIDELSKRGKLGILGMQERVQLLGGSFDIESQPGRGTTISVSAPVRS